MALRLYEGSKDREELAPILNTHWNNRGVIGRTEYWAGVYLDLGHKREVANEEFFVYERREEIIGIASLITYIYDIAQIRDELIVGGEDKDKYFTSMIAEIIKIAKLRKIRKVFSFSLPEYVEEYEKLGFKREGVLKDHYLRGEELVIMSFFLVIE